MTKKANKTMNIFSTKISIPLLSLLAGLFMSSCIYQEMACEDAESGDDLVELRLNINTIATRAQASSTIEKVNSFRVIMINKENGCLELNEQVKLPASENADGFSYTYRRDIPYGEKKFYLIGNEGNVGQVSLADPSVAPSGMPTTSLTAMLDFFKTETGQEKNEYVGTQLEAVLNNVYFNNDNVGAATGNNVSLPYSSYYEVNVKYHSKANATMYLVPVAAKLDFVVSNYRQKDVKIEDIEVSWFNHNNFLNAQLDPSETTKKINGVNTWWIDWLEACATASQDSYDRPNDNLTFNERWGWIEKYSLPLPEETRFLKQLNPTKANWTVGKLLDPLNPPKLVIGSYYLPESKNTTVPSDLSDEEKALLKDGDQSYWVTFKLHDTDTPEITTLANYNIDTVKALFRATHVVVYVELYESKVDIYTQIEPWSKSLFIGYVQQDDTD